MREHTPWCDICHVELGGFSFDLEICRNCYTRLDNEEETNITEMDDERAAANARMIAAAAPAMYAALTAIMNGQLGGAVDHDAARFQQARAVLAQIDRRQA